MPHSPGSGSIEHAVDQPRRSPTSAVLTNCVPIAFAGVSSSTTVSSMTICSSGRDDRDAMLERQQAADVRERVRHGRAAVLPVRSVWLT